MGMHIIAFHTLPDRCGGDAFYTYKPQRMQIQGSGQLAKLTYLPTNQSSTLNIYIHVAV